MCVCVCVCVCWWGQSGEAHSGIPQMRITLMRRYKGSHRRQDNSHLIVAEEVNDSMGNLYYLVYMCVGITQRKTEI